MNQVKSTACRLSASRSIFSLTQRTIADLYESYFAKKISQTHICRFEKLQLTQQNLIAMEPVIRHFLDILPQIVKIQPVKLSQRKRGLKKKELKQIELKKVQKRKRSDDDDFVCKKNKTNFSTINEVRICKSVLNESFDSGVSEFSCDSDRSSDDRIQAGSVQHSTEFEILSSVIIPDNADVFNHDGNYSVPHEIVPDYFVDLESDYKTVYGETSFINFDLF